MEFIEIKDTKIYLNSETQTSKLCRPFRLSGVAKNTYIPPLWIGNVERWHWIYTFIYLDDQGGIFNVEIDYNNNFLKLEKKSQ